MQESLWAKLSGIVAVTALTFIAAPAASASPLIFPSSEASASQQCVRSGEPEDRLLAVPFRGTTYSVLAHVPGVKGQKKLPLVLNLHGSGSNGAEQMALSGMREVADEQRFVVIAPTADIPLAPLSTALPDGGWAWNVPGVPVTSGNYPPADARDDVAFLKTVVDVATADLCTDSRRTYATGFSGGGRMVSALACEASDVFAAAAPVAGLRAGQPDPLTPSLPVAGNCQPTNPVPVVTFHGDADPVNPYAGNSDKRWGYSLALAASEWSRFNGCRVGPVLSHVNQYVTLQSWRKCDKGAEIQVYTIAGGGHAWPGGISPSRPEAVDHKLKAARIIFNFFAEHHLRS